MCDLHEEEKNKLQNEINKFIENDNISKEENSIKVNELCQNYANMLKEFQRQLNIKEEIHTNQLKELENIAEEQLKEYNKEYNKNISDYMDQIEKLNMQIDIYKSNTKDQENHIKDKDSKINDLEKSLNKQKEHFENQKQQFKIKIDNFQEKTNSLNSLMKENEYLKKALNESHEQLKNVQNSKQINTLKIQNNHHIDIIKEKHKKNNLDKEIQTIGTELTSEETITEIVYKKPQKQLIETLKIENIIIEGAVLKDKENQTTMIQCCFQNAFNLIVEKPIKTSLKNNMILKKQIISMLDNIYKEFVKEVKQKQDILLKEKEQNFELQKTIILEEQKEILETERKNIELSHNTNLQSMELKYKKLLEQSEFKSKEILLFKQQELEIMLKNNKEITKEIRKEYDTKNLSIIGQYEKLLESEKERIKSEYKENFKTEYREKLQLKIQSIENKSQQKLEAMKKDYKKLLINAIRTFDTDLCKITEGMKQRIMGSVKSMENIKALIMKAKATILMQNKRIEDEKLLVAKKKEIGRAHV